VDKGPLNRGVHLHVQCKASVNQEGGSTALQSLYEKAAYSLSFQEVAYTRKVGTCKLTKWSCVLVISN